MPYVILLHFDAPIIGRQRCLHYLEYADNIKRRLADHTSGDRTRTVGLMFALYERNIGFTVARIWHDADRRDEYRLRFTRRNPQLCPICNPALELQTAYNPNNVDTWRTVRVGRPDEARYGDLETLAPYKYRQRHRTRSNGEHNYIGGKASTYDAHRNQLAAEARERMAAKVADDIGAATDVPAEIARGWIDNALNDSAAFGFDADLPY